MKRLALGGVVAALLLPLLPLVVWAVSGQWRYPDLLPGPTSARGLDVITEAHAEVLRGLLTSFTVAGSVAVLSVAIGIPAGRALGLHRMRGRRILQLSLLAPVLVPGLAVTLGIQVVFLRLGLAATLPGVVLVHLVPAVPYATLLMTAAFTTFDVDHEQQARVLGAGPLRTAVLVTLPLLRPAIGASALLAFLISWNEYVLTLVIGAGQVKTLPILLFAAIGSTDTTAAAALSLLLIGPPLLLVTLLGARLSTAFAPAPS